MNDNDRIEITVGDVKRMAEKCPTAREVLKQGFPSVFETEWEDITESVVMKWHQHSEGFDIHFYDQGRSIGYLYPGGEVDVCEYKMGGSKYKAVVVGEPRSRTVKILRRKP
jgi:hypothetical protein